MVKSGSDRRYGSVLQLSVFTQPQWKADATSYFGRVPKSMTLDAVRDGAGVAAAAELSGLNKAPMAGAATRQLDGKDWLPSLLRTPQDEALAEAAE